MNRTAQTVVLSVPVRCPDAASATEKWLLALWQAAPKSIWSSWHGQSPISLEYLARHSAVHFQAHFANRLLADLSRAVLPALYPGVEIDQSDDDLQEIVSSKNAALVTFRLRSPGWIDLPKDGEPESVSGIIGALARQASSGSALVQLLLDPIWMTTEEGKQPAFRMSGRILVTSTKSYDPALKTRLVASSFGQLAGFNGLRFSDPRHASRADLAAMVKRHPHYRFVPPGSPMTAAQVARVYHPPEGVRRHDPLTIAPCFRAPALPLEGDLSLGEARDARGYAAPLRLQTADLLRHAFVLGPTGSGKTTLLSHLARELASAGHGVTVLDPHGSLVRDIARTLPPDCQGALVRFSDTDFPVGLNPLRPRSGRDFVAADELVEVIERVYGREYWGPLIDLTLRHAAMATIEIGGSLVDSARLLDDASFRERALQRIDNPETARVLERLGDGLDRRILPAINRLQRLVAVPWLRNIVGQTGRGLDFRELFDRREIALFDLSGIGATNARLLGSLILLLIRQATLTRSSETLRQTRHFVLIDEASWFLSRTVSELFDQARKFGVGMVLATQRIGQLTPESVREAVLSNSGTVLTFRVGSREEAVLLERHFASDRIGSEDLRHLPRYEGYVQLTRDGDRLEPAWLRAAAPAVAPKDATTREWRLADAARRRYARPRDAVEAELRSHDEALTDNDEPEIRELANARASFPAHAA